MSETHESALPVHVVGVGLWSPGFPNAPRFLAGEPDPEVKKPPCALVKSRMKRATSILTRSAVEVTTQAIEAAGWPLEEVATVFGSQHGEIQIAVEQMQMMQEGSGVVSPARFKNSVHNTAAGLFSIAATNKRFTTAIAAGAHTFAMCLLEAWGLMLADEAERVVVTVGEEPLPAPITHFSPHRALALSFALARDAAPERSLGLIGRPERGEGEATPVDAGFEGHTAAGGLRLLRALHGGHEGALALSPGWQLPMRAARARAATGAAE